MINIGEKIDDFYRYKMPSPIIKYEGKKTVLVNAKIISDSLHRDLRYLLQFINHDLSTSTKIFIDDNLNEKCVIKGIYASNQIQKTINKFIETFVLCPVCNLPETILSINVKKETVKHKCNACGVKTLIDNKHKLTKFILKNL